MGNDPAAALQLAFFAVLNADAGMIEAFGGAPRIYDQVPLAPGGGIDTALFPYVTIGDDQLVGRTNQNTDPTEIFAKVEVWSRSTNKIECKTIAGAVRTALDAQLPIDGFEVVTHTFHGAQYRREPDGLTDRAIITLRYIVAPLGALPYELQP